MITPKTQKNAKYICENCEYITYNKTDYTRHLLTSKHLINNTNLLNNIEQIHHCICSCGKSYKYRY